jgi:hypothetical protein
MALWVESEARRANRNLLMVNGGMLAVLFLIVAVNYRYCANWAASRSQMQSWQPLPGRNNAGAILSPLAEQNP